MMNISKYADYIIEQAGTEILIGTEAVDAIEFVTSAAYLCEDPTPFQRVVLKTLYSLWELYPPDAEEEALLKILENKWRIPREWLMVDFIKFLVLTLGRRSTKCVPYNTKIADASTGKRYNVGELYDNKNLRPPIFTLSDNYKLQSVTDYTVMYNGKNQLYRIRTKAGFKSEFNGNHPLLTLEGWKEVKDIKVGDRIGVPKGYNMFNTNQASTLLPEEARLLGYLIGDGSTAGNNSFTNYDEIIVKDFKKVVDKLDCETTEFREHHFSIKGKSRKENLELKLIRKHGVFGVKAIHKKVPDVIFELSKEITTEFLRALFACDSNVAINRNNKGGWFNYSSSSEELIYGVHHLLLKYGIVGIVKERRVSYYNKKYQERRYFKSYNLVINQYEYLKILYEEIGIVGIKYKKLKKLYNIKKHKKIDNTLVNTIPVEIWKYIEKLRQQNSITLQQMRKIGGGYITKWAPSRGKIKKFATFFNDEYLYNVVNSDVIWDFVAEKKKTTVEDTYDLSVPGTANFIGDDIIMHNSTMSSYVATYAMYTLICRGNPQKYYGIRERHPIFITHVASAGKQAAAVFTLTADNIKKVPLFRPYIDFDKDNTTELRLFSPHDLILNKRIKARNMLVPKGVMRENTLPGSLNIRSITTSAASSRGDAIFMLIFSEFAHFQRAKYEGMKSGDQIIEENPQTDYAIAKALMPSVKDFKADGKIICESSPAEKGGQHYLEYCTAGGYEQEGIKNVLTGITERPEPEPGYALIQLATWEARPGMPREDFEADFRKDPRGANMEYGAHFGNPSGQFIEEVVIKKIPVPGRPLIRKNPGTWKFIIIIDPGGKAKDKKDDTYAVGWGHYEGKPHEDESTYRYWIDGMEGWNAEIKDLGGGRYEQIPVDANKVVSFIVDLTKDLGGRNWIQEICYDQWNCLAEDTLVDTNYGLVPVESIYNNFGTKDYYVFFKKKKYRIKNIVCNGVQPIQNITTKFGYNVRATLKHRFKTRKGLRYSSKWNLVSKLNRELKCEIVHTPLWADRNVDISNFSKKLSPYTSKAVCIPKRMSKELASILGYIVAEGEMDAKETRLSFTNYNIEILNHFSRLCKKVFNNEGKVIFHSETGKPCRIDLYSVDICKFLVFLGYRQGSENKVVPWCILQSKKDIVTEFLRVYFEGDGSSVVCVGDLNVNAWSRSNKLLHQIQFLLTKFGIISSLQDHTIEEYLNYKHIKVQFKDKVPHTIWILTLRGKNIKQYRDSIGFFSKEKTKHLDEVISKVPSVRRNSKRYFREDFVYLDRVKDNEDGGKCKVFDIEVEDEEHQFSANGFVSHNSQSSVAALQSLGFPAIETTFTNPYKAEMYGNFLEKAQLEQVKMYGIDEKGWVDRWMLEMKYLQQIISGKVVFYRHPSTGPVQTDDFCDVSANLVHRLVRMVAPSRESIKNNRRLGVPGGFQKRKTVSPIRGPSLHKGNIFPKYRNR